MNLPNKIAWRSVKIVKADGTNGTIAEDINELGNIISDSGIKDLFNSFSEEVTPFILDSDSFDVDIDNTTSKLSSALGGLVGKGGKLSSFAGKVAGVVTTGSEIVSAVTAVGDQEREFGAAWNPWFLNMPTWENTKIQDLKLKFTFKLGQYGLWNAAKEVVLPTLALIVPTIPRRLDSFMMTGPFPSTIALLIDFASKLADPQKAGDTTTLAGAILSTLKAHTYHISIGNVFSLMYAIPTKAAVNMSTNLDVNGMPIQSSVTITFQGAVPPALNHGTDVPIGLRFGGTSPDKG